MNEVLPTIRQTFHLLFITMHGPESDPTVRVLLVEATGAQAVYEGFGSWSECERWVIQISGSAVPGDQLAAVRKRLGEKRSATIREVLASLDDLDSIGLHRANS